MSRSAELSGFGSHVASEAVLGALPVGQNSPQQPPLGLYAEQLSGTAFTAPRATNQRSWLYRIAPSVGGSASEPLPSRLQADFSDAAAVAAPDPHRWRPLPLPTGAPVTFVEGLVTMCGAGGPALKEGEQAPGGGGAPPPPPGVFNRGGGGSMGSCHSRMAKMRA